jgi:glycosyltransferase involved in cell wall biosynthesis
VSEAPPVPVSGLPTTLSVIVPVYNEASTLEIVVQRLLRLSVVHEVIVVDDGSTDATPAIAERLAATQPRVSYYRQPRNAGKTAALRTGFARSTGDIVIVQDADLEYDPDDIADVIRPILDGDADVSYGSRFIVKRAARVLYFYHFLANKLLTFLSNLLTNLNLTDVETGYKAFRGEIIRNMVITSHRFGFEIEVTAKIAKLRCRVYETPINYYGRTYEEGKKIGLRDGVEAFWLIAKYNLFVNRQRSFTKLPELPRSEVRR